MEMRLRFCVACGADSGLEHHHLVPRSRGGSEDETNLITLCWKCHDILHECVAQGLSRRQLIDAGRARAMAAGVRFGRKLKLAPHQRDEAIKRRANGETLAEIASTYGVSVSMISRLRG